MLARRQQLHIGDRIRFIQMPSSADWPHLCFHAETKALYKRLIARRRPSRVDHFDEWNLPWIRYRFRNDKGRWEFHMLAVDDDSWMRVKSRSAPDRFNCKSVEQ